MDFKKEPLLKKIGAKAVRVSFLSPEQAEGLAEPRQRKKLLVLFFIFGVIAPALVAGFFIFRQQARQTEITATEKKIAVLNDFFQTNDAAVKQVNQISKAIAAAKPLLQNRFLFTKFFTSLEDNTLPEVSFNSVAVDAKGVNLVGKAPDYRTVARQIIAFKTMPLAQDLKISGLSGKPAPKGGGLEEVNFTLFLSFDKTASR
ncbi:MAG: hypothetical protein Q8M83_04625 [bacterium]|nr:hypothetical protein [bacterium]